MALINNYVGLRPDVSIVSKHVRRPIPVRTDSIGPWLVCLRFLTWIAIFVNCVLVYVFRLRSLGMAPGARQSAYNCALLTYDVIVVLRWAVWYFVKRVFWRGSEEKMKSEELELQIDDVGRLGLIMDARVPGSDSAEDEDTDNFWKQDEGPWKDCDT